MIEYPSMQNSSKAPRKSCIAFDKLDGSGFRAKWTKKKGFDTYGTRTQIIDYTTPFWNQMVSCFERDIKEPLEKHFSKEYRDEREIIVFGEFFGPDSFAGRHTETNDFKIVVFDILVGHKNRKLIRPQDFIKQYSEIIEIPRVIYKGNLNEELIKDVREGKYDVNEGVICKGTEPTGAAFGGIWQCKIKTQNYLNRLQAEIGADWKKYWE